MTNLQPRAEAHEVMTNLQPRAKGAQDDSLGQSLAAVFWRSDAAPGAPQGLNHQAATRRNRNLHCRLGSRRLTTNSHPSLSPPGPTPTHPRVVLDRLRQLELRSNSHEA